MFRIGVLVHLQCKEKTFKMKKFAFVFLFCFISEFAFSQNVINYFQVSENIAKPVTIKTSNGTYKIYGGERIDGNLYSVSAYDANGNQIAQNTPYKTETASGKPTVRYYYFKTVYNSSHNNNYESSTSSHSSAWADKMGNAAMRASSVPMEGYPNLQVRLGYSFLAAEALSVKIQLGGMGGFNLTGGVGKNLFRNEPGLSMWYGGVGYYGGDEVNDFSFNVLMGVDDDILLCGEIEYSHFFDAVPRLGLFIAGRLGAHVSSSFFLDLHAGVSWKLFSN